MDWIKLLPDEEVVSRLVAKTVAYRKDLPEVLGLLAEVDSRKLYAAEGCNSTFDYCLRKLRYSEDEAYRRIHAGRAAVLYPRIYDLLREGRLSLSAVSKLAPHLASDNADELLAKAEGKTKRQLDQLLADLQQAVPLPPDRVRPIKVVLPSQAPTSTASDAGPLFSPPAVHGHQPESRVCYEHTFVASPEFEAALESLKELLSSKYPFGRLEDYLSEAVFDFLADKRPLAKPPKEMPKSSSSGARRIARALRHAVWARDGGRCSFVSPDGRRCECRRALQLDHIVPFSEGGKTTLSNLRLLCLEHNQLERRRKLGEGRGAPAQDRLAPGLDRRSALKLLKEESAQLPLPS